MTAETNCATFCRSFAGSEPVAATPRRRAWARRPRRAKTQSTVFCIRQIWRRGVANTVCDEGRRSHFRRDLAQPLHRARSLAEHADAGVGVEQVRHGGRLQRFCRRQLALLGPRKCRVADVNRIKKTCGPGFWFQRFQHNRLAVVTHADLVRGEVKAFRQAHGLTLAFVDDGCCFHNRVRSKLLLRCQSTTFHACA